MTQKPPPPPSQPSRATPGPPLSRGVVAPSPPKNPRPKGLKPLHGGGAADAETPEGRQRRFLRPGAARRTTSRRAFTDPDQASPDLRTETAQGPPVNLITLLMAALLGLTLALAPYCALPLPDVAGAALRDAGLGGGHVWPAPAEGFSVTLITPLIPVALFIGGLLGWGLGALVVGAFLALGLAGLPLFADGGGWEYVSRPGFGYLVGALVGAVCAGIVLSSRSQAKEGKSLYAIRAIATALIAVALAHACGLIGLTAQFLAGRMTFQDLGQWAVYLSGMPAPYDALISAALLGLVRPLRMMLWMVMY